MKDSETERRRSAWSAYWADGTLHSLPSSFAGNYGGELGRFWLDVFRLLPAESRVLDIATGNGALPKMLLDTAAATPARIDAIDVADLAPAWIAQGTADARARIHFHARTPAEALPFADGTFDLCASQYGIEYSDLSQSVPQALRVTRADGLLAWVLHHRESHTVRLADEDRAHCAWLLGAEGPFEAALAVAAPAAQSASADAREALRLNADAERLRLNFNAAMERLSRRAATAKTADALHHCARTIMETLRKAHANGAKWTQAQLHAIRQSLLHDLDRKDDLLAHAPGPEVIAWLEATIRQARPEWSVTHRLLSLDFGLAGQSLVAGKAETIARLRP